MKRISYILLFVAAFASCTKNTPVGEECSDLLFRVSSLDTRAAFEAGQAGLSVAWEDGDIIGISASHGDELVGVNYAYMLSSGKESVLEPTSTIYRYEASEEETTYYAYYPYSGETGSGVHYLAPLTLSAEQSYNPAEPLAYLKDNWMMKAAPCVLSSATSLVDLTFSGVFSIVELKLRYSKSASRSYPLEKVTLKSSGSPLAVSAGNLRLDTSVEDDALQSPIIINTGVDSVALVLDDRVTLSAGVDRVFYYMLAPGRHKNQEISVILNSSNGYRAEVKIAEGVTLKPNTVYHKSVTVNPDMFVSVKPEQKYTPVNAPDDLVSGEYLMVFDHTDGKSYLLPTVPVTKNPKLVSFDEADVDLDQAGNITSVSDGHLWTVVKDGSLWKFSYVENGITYKLIGANKAQGITISDTLTGAYDVTYYDTWSVTKQEDAVCIQVSEVSSRWFVAYTDGIGTSQFQNGGSSYGSWKFYKKTKVTQ